jgi:hypothetical protein
LRWQLKVDLIEAQEPMSINGDQIPVRYAFSTWRHMVQSYVHSEDAVKTLLGLICEQPVFIGGSQHC